ncbi:MAG: hypothetical protein AB7K24_15100 [Gemmataceae bacterium]
MTEQEWLTSNDPIRLMDWLRTKPLPLKDVDRRFRLFACAVARRVWPKLEDDSCLKAIEVAEQHCDGVATSEELQLVWTAVFRFAENATGRTKRRAQAISCCAEPANAIYHIEHLARDATYIAVHSLFGSVQPEERAAQASLLKDVLGNPFRPLAIEPAILTWRDGAVKKLAEACYWEDRELPSGHLHKERLAICADAVEESGGPEELLVHLRGPVTHVRGCFAIDLLRDRA